MEVSNQTASGGSAPAQSGNGIWPGPFSDTLATGIMPGNYKLCVVITNGTLSNVGVSASFTIDIAAPILSGLTVTPNGGNLDWGVTTDQGTGAIYAALRDALDSPLSALDIVIGTGGALTSDSDTTPTEGSGNAGMIPQPAAGTYVIDVVQVDGLGNISNVVSSADIVVVPAALSVACQGNSGVYKSMGTAHQIDMTGVSAGDWLVIGVTQSSGGGNDLEIDEVLVEGVSATRLGHVVNSFRKAAVFKLACPAGAAGNAVVAFAATASTTLDITGGVVEDSTAVAVIGRLHKSASANDIPGGPLALTANAGSSHAVAIAAELEAV